MSRKSFEAPKHIELEAFATVLDTMEKQGVTFIGIKGIDLDTGKEVVIPSQTFAVLIVADAVKKEDFLKMMGKSQNLDEYDINMTVEHVEKNVPFGSTMS